MCRFLLVSLNVDAILEGVTIGQRRNKLEEMARGNGLSDAYTATLNRLKAQNRNKSVLGLNVLMWVLNSERPLQADELCHALGVGIGSRDVNPDNVPALKVLLSSCLGLVTVEASSSTVRLVHFTLQEHLSSDPTLFHCPHSTIAEVCLTYLNFGYVRDLSPDVDKVPSAIPFLNYASCYWGEHARREMTENVKVLALRLLDRFDLHISSGLLLSRYIEDSKFGRYLNDTEGPKKFTGLHGAACLGIMQIFTAVLEMKEWDVNAGDCLGGTALTWAAEKGHEGVVKMLLERDDINPDQADADWGSTPLIWAANHEHEGVVKLLLEREDVNPNATEDVCGCTALSWALESGYVGVVKMLLERKDVNPDYVDHSSKTPLLWAAENGHEGIVKMLLERKDVHPDLADTEYGETPLSWAAENGHEGVVKILLERKDVNPDHVDDSGKTPLLWAAKNGHEGVVKMLLERKDVNPDHADTHYGKTSLLWAAENGHEGIVKMLLERKDVNPGHVDHYGETPLSWAAENGRERVVKMLSERKDVNPSQADIKSGRTPLQLAALYGRAGVVKILLERKDVNPDQADTESGQTPLSLAAGAGHGGLVKILLERQDVDPNHVDTKYGRTPLT